jgi:hypothetical protein
MNKKIPRLKRNDIYNQVTKEYLPSILDAVYKGGALFPNPFRIYEIDSWEYDLPKKEREVYKLYLTKKYNKTWEKKFQTWDSKGHPIRFKDHTGLILGKVIGVTKETVLRELAASGTLTVRIPNIKPLMKAKDIIVLDVVKLTSLEYCEVLEKAK